MSLIVASTAPPTMPETNNSDENETMCWLFNACNYDQVVRFLDRHGVFIGFMTVVITVGAVGIAFACRKRGGLEDDIEQMLDDARRRLNETNRDH